MSDIDVLFILDPAPPIGGKGCYEIMITDFPDYPARGGKLPVVFVEEDFDRASAEELMRVYVALSKLPKPCRVAYAWNDDELELVRFTVQ